MCMCLTRPAGSAQGQDRRIAQHTDTPLPYAACPDRSRKGSCDDHTRSCGDHTRAAAKVRHPDTFYPRCLTVDASQGLESLMVILDGAFQHCDRIGKNPTAQCTITANLGRFHGGSRRSQRGDDPREASLLDHRRGAGPRKLELYRNSRGSLQKAEGADGGCRAGA